MTHHIDSIRKSVFNQAPRFVTGYFNYYGDWLLSEDDSELSSKAIMSWTQGGEGYCELLVKFAVDSNSLQSITVECTPKDEAMTAYVVFDVNGQQQALTRWGEFIADYGVMRQTWLDGLGE